MRQSLQPDPAGLRQSRPLRLRPRLWDLLSSRRSSRRTSRWLLVKVTQVSSSRCVSVAVNGVYGVLERHCGMSAYDVRGDVYGRHRLRCVAGVVFVAVAPKPDEAHPSSPSMIRVARDHRGPGMAFGRGSYVDMERAIGIPCLGAILALDASPAPSFEIMRHHRARWSDARSSRDSVPQAFPRAGSRRTHTLHPRQSLSGGKVSSAALQLHALRALGLGALGRWRRSEFCSSRPLSLSGSPRPIAARRLSLIFPAWETVLSYRLTHLSL